jgi:hypothetical protein
MTNAVFVLDQDRKPLKPVHAAVARKMLGSGQASVFRRYPFTLICKPGIRTGEAEGVRLKLDPGSKTTGIALLVGDAVIWAAELVHRGQRIKAALDSRRPCVMRPPRATSAAEASSSVRSTSNRAGTPWRSSSPRTVAASSASEPPPRKACTH